MNADKGGLTPGLYLVAVPIGNARDITLRALDVLRDADILAAEDTRSLRRLLEIHGVDLRDRQCLPYHDHNGDRMRPKLLGALAEGRSVAYASEAGTPMISDPGFDLARAARADGHDVTTAPGVSAVVTALTLGGLPTDRFFFAGFLPNSRGPRGRALEDLRDVAATLVFYESPKRLGAMLADAADKLGPGRPATVCRELTKRFEEAREGTLAELAAHYENQPPKGEIVVLVGKGSSEKINELDVDNSLTEALETMSVRDAADAVSGLLGVKRRAVYQRALALAKGRDQGD